MRECNCRQILSPLSTLLVLIDLSRHGTVVQLVASGGDTGHKGLMPGVSMARAAAALFSDLSDDESDGEECSTMHS